MRAILECRRSPLRETSVQAGTRGGRSEGEGRISYRAYTTRPPRRTASGVTVLADSNLAKQGRVQDHPRPFTQETLHWRSRSMTHRGADLAVKHADKEASLCHL